METITTTQFIQHLDVLTKYLYNTDPVALMEHIYGEIGHSSTEAYIEQKCAEFGKGQFFFYMNLSDNFQRSIYELALEKYSDTL